MIEEHDPNLIGVCGLIVDDSALARLELRPRCIKMEMRVMRVMRVMKVRRGRVLMRFMQVRLMPSKNLTSFVMLA